MSGRVIYALRGQRIGFVRLFGWGIAWQDTSRHRELFSDRERRFVQLRIGSWLITPLPRDGRGFRRRRP